MQRNGAAKNAQTHEKTHHFLFHSRVIFQAFHQVGKNRLMKVAWSFSMRGMMKSNQNFDGIWAKAGGAVATVLEQGSLVNFLVT